MEEDFEEIDWPARSITHAFHQIETATNRNGFLRLASRHQDTVDDRNIRFKPDMDPEERFWHKQLGYAKCCFNEICRIPLKRIRITGETKHVSVQGELATTTNFNVTLIFHNYETTREQIIEKMDQRTSNNWYTRLWAVTKDWQTRRWHDNEWSSTCDNFRRRTRNLFEHPRWLPIEHSETRAHAKHATKIRQSRTQPRPRKGRRKDQQQDRGEEWRNIFGDVFWHQTKEGEIVTQRRQIRRTLQGDRRMQMRRNSLGRNQETRRRDMGVEKWSHLHGRLLQSETRSSNTV